MSLIPFPTEDLYIGKLHPETVSPGEPQWVYEGSDSWKRVHPFHDVAYTGTKTLNTDNATAQAVNGNETIAGVGSISLHKVSKTGDYGDLLNTPFTFLNDNQVLFGKLEQSSDLTWDGFKLQIAGDLTVQGDLSVLGTEFIADVETVRIADNLAIINYGEAGSGITAGFAGWEADRGTLTNYRWGFEESTESWRIGQVGDLQAVATREDNPTDGQFVKWNEAQNRLDTSVITESDITDLGDYLTSLAHNHGIANSGGTQQFTFGIDESVRFEGGDNTSVAFDSTTNKVIISSTDNTMREPATVNPLAHGTAAVGTSLKYARQDHVHPSDNTNTWRPKPDWDAAAGSDSEILNKPDLSNYLTDHQSIKSLDTDNSVAVTVNNNEAIAGTGSISLHKVSKTGSYEHLLNKPDLSDYLTSLAHNHGIANSGGTQQFVFGVDQNVRFEGSGATSIGFDSGTRKVTIHSVDTNTDTVTQIRRTDSDGSSATSYRTGNISLREGNNLTITEVSTGVFQFSTSVSSEDNYVNSVSGSGNGTLTLGRTGSLSDLTTNLSHDHGAGEYTDNYVNSVSGSGNGTLTLGRTGSLSDLTTSLSHDHGAGEYTDTNFYLDNLSFDTSTSVLTASVKGATDQTVDLSSLSGGDNYYLTDLNLDGNTLKATVSGVTGTTDVNLSSILHDQQHSITSLSDHTFPGGTTNFLRADGEWHEPSGGGSLPSGDVNQTMRHDGSEWTSTDWLKILSRRVEVNRDELRINDTWKLIINGDVLEFYYRVETSWIKHFEIDATNRQIIAEHITASGDISGRDINA